MAKHQNAGIVSSVMLNCEYGIQANGTISGNISTACRKAITGLKHLKVGAELWLGEQDSIDAAHRLFANPSLAAASLVHTIDEFGLDGINFDLEPGRSNASDAKAYGTFLRAIRPAVNTAGARLTVDAALWTPMLAQMGAYEDAVDRVLYMHSYYAGSLEEWLEYLRPVLDEHTLPRSKLGAGLAIFHDARTAGWADTAEAPRRALLAFQPIGTRSRALPYPPRRRPRVAGPVLIDPLHAYASGSVIPDQRPRATVRQNGWDPTRTGAVCVAQAQPAARTAPRTSAPIQGRLVVKPEDYHHHPYTCCLQTKRGFLRRLRLHAPAAEAKLRGS